MTAAMDAIGALPKKEAFSKKKTIWNNSPVDKVLSSFDLENSKTADGDDNAKANSHKQWQKQNDTIVHILSERQLSQDVTAEAEKLAEKKIITTVFSSKNIKAESVSPSDHTSEQKLIQLRKSLVQKAVVDNLKTGKFDAVDLKLLRTCSEPDLAMLLHKKERSREEAEMKSNVHQLKKADSMTAVHDQDDEISEIIGKTESDTDTEESDGCLKYTIADMETYVEVADVNSSDSEQNSEDEDMQTLRASMASILKNDCERDADEVLDNSFEIKKMNHRSEKTKKMKECLENGPLLKVLCDSTDDLQCMKQTMRTLLLPEDNKQEGDGEDEFFEDDTE